MAFVHDAYQHLKTIGFSADAQPLLDQAGVVADAAVVNLAKDHAAAFVKAAQQRQVVRTRNPCAHSVLGRMGVPADTPHPPTRWSSG